MLPKTNAIASILTIAAALALSGCKSPIVTKPQRSALEQLLLSNAVDKALETADIPQVGGKRVFVAEDYLESYDGRYVVGSIRAALSENDALLVENRDEAEIILEARSGALGIDTSSTLLGLPSIPIIIPGAGSVELPSIALYKSREADSVTKLAFLAYEADTGKHVYSSGSLVGKSNFYNYTLLFLLDINFTDIPERKKF